MSGPNGESQSGVNVSADQILDRSKSAQEDKPAIAMSPELAEQIEALISSFEELEPVQHTKTYWHSERPSKTNEVFDSPDEIATKEVVKQYLAEHQEAPGPNHIPMPMPDLPVQYNNATAQRLYKLSYKPVIESNREQGIQSQLYKGENGKIVFCMDARSEYKLVEEIDSCYSYARKGISLYLSQHLLYTIYGVEDIAFIADKAEAFYKDFMRDIKAYQLQLSNGLNEDERAQALNLYARHYLSYIADKIADELTAAFGEQNKEFKNNETSLESLGSIVPAAIMAVKPIPYVVIDNNIPELSIEYATIVHPKPWKMTDKIKQYWSETLITDKAKERKPLPAADIEPLLDADDKERKPLPASDIEPLLDADDKERKPLPASDIEPLLDKEDDEATYNFLDELHPCEKALLHYLEGPILAGEVAFPSQFKKAPGAKHFRTFEQTRVLRDENGIQLPKIGNTTGCTTAVTRLKKATPAQLKTFTKATLEQQQAMMARGTDREDLSYNISLYGIDLTTPLANKFFNKSIVPADAQAIATTQAVAEDTENALFDNRTVNHERLLAEAPKFVQNIIAELADYDDLHTMLPFIHCTEGMNKNVRDITDFRNEFKKAFTDEELQRLEAYLGLMVELEQRHQSERLDKLEIILDTIAISVLLCNTYNELILKYDTNKKYKTILVSLNCQSGNNRSGAVISHCMNLFRTADIIVEQFGVGELKNLLHPKYYSLRLAVGDKQETIGLIGKNNDTWGTKGIRKQSEGSISRTHVSEAVRKKMCTPESEFKGLMEDVYISEEKRTIEIFSVRALNQPAETEDRSVSDETLVAEKIGLISGNRDLDPSLSPIQPISEVMDLNIEKVGPTPSCPSIQADYVSDEIDEKKPSLTAIVLDRIAAFVPKEIGSIGRHLGLDFFSAQPKSVGPVIQANPSNEVIVLSSKETDLVGDPHLDLPPIRQEKQTAPIPQKPQRERKSDLKKGSIIASIGMVVAALVTFIVEAHSGISVFGAASLLGAAITGWLYAREEENSKPYSSSSNQTFFSPKLVSVDDDSNKRVPRPG